MDDMMTPRPGDRVTFLDGEDATERHCIVTAYVPDAGYGFPGFVSLDPITDEHRWGYLSQILELNGVATVV